MSYKILIDNTRLCLDGKKWSFFKKGDVINTLPKAVVKELLKRGTIEETPKPEPKNKSGKKSLKPATENKAINPVAEDK